MLQPGNAVAPQGAPGPQVSAASTGGIAASQMQDLGDKLETAGDNYVMLQNQVRVNDAMNQVRQKALDLTFDPNNGYQAKRGVNALQPDDNGQSLPQAYGQKLGDAIDQIGATLTPAQQRVFRMQAQDTQTNFVGGVQSHMLQQSQQYALSVQDTNEKLAGQEAAQYWRQDDKINGTANPTTGMREGGLVQQAQAAAYATSKLTGMDSQAAIAQAGSSVHRAVIQSALENGDPLYAMQYMNRYAKQMTTPDILAVQGAITAQGNAQVAQQAVANAVAKMTPAVVPTDYDRLHNLVANAESSNRETNPDGSTVTSSAGAQGRMQVMPGTQTDPGFGVKPAALNPDGTVNAADRARVGRDYLDTMVKRYNGNLAQALAAYHDGPGAVDKAIADAKAVDEPGIWMQTEHISDAGRAYVMSILPKYQANGGVPQLPTKDAFVQSAIGELGTNATLPQIAMVRQAAEARFETIMKSRDELGDQALRNVQQALVANGGDYAALQRDQPELISRLAQTSPGKVDDAMRFGRELANGDRPDNLAAYAAAVLHPDELAAMPEGKFNQLITTQFSRATGEKLARERAAYANGSSDNSPQTINNAAFNTALKERLNSVGLDATPKATDVTGSARVGAVQKFLRDGIYAAQQQAGKKFTQEEVSNYIDRAFRQNQVLPHWYGDANVPMLRMQWGDVPSDHRKAIEAALPKGASDTDKLRLYWAGQQTKPQ